MWRGSLLPQGCEAAPNPATTVTGFAPAAQSSGSKLPRHSRWLSETPELELSRLWQGHDDAPLLCNTRRRFSH
ncbi:hypothetical protein C9422_20565 [Pseudomonas sp. B1(2018)]|nr:hypothetical protein C9422_20565 [Pseudomonas sp. B1(2018)]